MIDISDDELLVELTKRFNANKKSLNSVQDMTCQLKQLNLKLIQSEKMKGHFLSNIRNELNNPLSAIFGMSQILMGEDIDAQQRIDLANSINNEILHLTYQLTNIFIAAELDSGESTISYSKVNIKHVIEGVIECLQQKIVRKKLYVVIKSSEESCSLHEQETDPEKFKVIMTNLLTNAVEFAKQGSEISIYLDANSTTYYIKVDDFGEIISPLQYDSIFDRFYQIDSGIVKQHLGHGIGLTVSKAIIEMMGGTISVSSNAETEITSFTIALPINKVQSNISSEECNEFMFDE